MRPERERRFSSAAKEGMDYPPKRASERVRMYEDQGGGGEQASRTAATSVHTWPKGQWERPERVRVKG